MTVPDSAHKILAGADALSVACDRLDELSTPAVARRVSQLAAQIYQQAAEVFDGERDVHAARAAYAHASIHFTRAGIEGQAERMRRKAVRGMEAMKISLGGVPFDVALPPRESRDTE